MDARLSLALTLALALGATAAAQEPPAPAPSTPTEPQQTPPDRAAVKQRWRDLSPEERRRLQESYERWKTLSPEQKELLKRRHDRLDDERRATDKLLPDDDREQIAKQKAEQRRKELTERALKSMKERFNHLPPDLQERIRQELKNAPPGERAARMRALLQKEIAPQIRAALRRRVERGDLTRDEVESLARRVHEAPPAERARLLREFIVGHPQAFPLSAKLREQLRKNNDPLFDLRLLEQLQRNRARVAPPGHKPVRPPKEKGSDDANATAEGHKKV